MVKLLVIVDMEQLAANIMPARRQIRYLSLSNEVHFSGAARLSNLWSDGCPQAGPQYAQCVFGTSGIIRIALTRIDRKFIRLTAEHTVEDVTVSARVIGAFGRKFVPAGNQPCARAVCTALYAQLVLGTSAND